VKAAFFWGVTLCSLVASHGHFDSLLNVEVKVSLKCQQQATRLCSIKFPDFGACSLHLPTLHYVCARQSTVGENRSHHFIFKALLHIQVLAKLL
jgi:hypothetical protein